MKGVRFFTTLLLLTSTAQAGELRICTQNLHRYGDPSTPYLRTQRQERGLVERVARARCDLVAAQEIFSPEKRAAERNLRRLEEALETRTGEEFLSFVGSAVDDIIRNGLLVRHGVGEVVRVVDFAGRSLPRLSIRGRSSYFTRPPIGVLLRVDGRLLFVVTFHLKSKVGGWKDPTGLDFETVRMEMAEAIRGWAIAEEPEAVTLLAGDRNSEEMSASAAILRGTRTLSDFQHSGLCRVRPEGTAECGVLQERRARFVELFAGERDELKSYHYGGKLLQLDEILIQSENVGLVRAAEGGYVARAVEDFRDASDHKLLWIALRWEEEAGR